MTKMKIQTKFNFQRQAPEKLSGESMTHQTGYIPPKVRITEMILSGKRLAEAREEQFDRLKENDFEVPITRIRGVDMSEIIAKGKELQQKAIKAREDAEKALKEAKEAATRKAIEAQIIADYDAKLKAEQPVIE